ncbi:melanoma-associated antigen E1 isoform X2 [Cricetulus griseus]|uniref:Melanoma-associated antigen E1 n=2 Tax=Cricetulus griseus TaxID=10029 RepID=A0A9J7GLC3_CRIGR|nr:melanoma-associated antigen E1 isoform X2 [Cricetulus griseus]
MSLVSQNSRRRRGGRANGRNSSGKGLPAAVPDVPEGPSDPKVLQGPSASDGPGSSVLPIPREGPSTSVPPTAPEGSSASGQLIISEGPNTSELPISGEEGPGTSRPPAVSAGLNTAMSITAAEGLSTSVPPTAPNGSKASEHLDVSEGLNISEQPHSDEGPGVQPTLGEGLGTKVPPTFSEESGISVPLPSNEGLSTPVSPTISEGPGINVPSPASEAPSTSVPPTATDGLGINLPPTSAKGRSASVLLLASEEPDISVSPPSAKGRSTSMPPPSGEVRSTWVLPTILEGSSVNMPPTSKKGLRTSVRPAARENPSTSAGGRGTPLQSIAAAGFGISVASCAAEGSATCGLLPCGEGPSTSGLHILGKGPSTPGLHILGKGPSPSGLHILGKGPSISGLHSLREGPNTSQMPLAAEGRGASAMSTAADNPAAVSCGASAGMNLFKCTSLGLPKASAPSVRPKRSEGPLEFQVLRDSENSNSITIMGLGTAHVALTLKPQDPMEQNVAELLQFLLVKDQSKYPIKESEMREFIVKEYRHQFPEILRRAAAHLECIFRFELKELDPEERTYILLNKLGPVPYDGLEDIPNGPKMGLLMMILGKIFLNGNQAREADIWEMLWRFGVQRERRLSVFGNPKRLLSVEFVWQRYLDYRPITDCGPVEYEFYWGPRSHIETTKMKILRFMARIYNKDPMDWPEQYNEALEEDALRNAEDDWRPVAPFRRPFFEEVPPELLAPDSDAPGYSSKYSPHSWPESRLESKSRKLVQLFLLMDSTKLPIPKKGILYYIGRECSKVFPDLLNRAARTLNHVYGTELVVLDPRNHSYTLFNRREMEDTEEIVDSPNRPGNNFLMQVLSFIFIMGNHARESAVWAFLRGLGVQNGRKHVITCRYLSQRYIDSLRVPDSDPVQYDFVWGPRARLETSKMKALRYVARIHRKEPQDWPEQYREALEEEANRADAGNRALVVRNFRR